LILFKAMPTAPEVPDLGLLPLGTIYLDNTIGVGGWWLVGTNQYDVSFSSSERVLTLSL